MAPPANASFATAVTISTFPFTFTQSDINDAGTNYTVYYRFICPVGTVEIAAWGFSGNVGAGYQPRLRPYLGPAGAPTSVLSIDGQNVPVLIPVVAGQEYFLEFLKNSNTAGPEHIDIKVELAPNNNVITGDIAVHDDGPGFPAIILSPTVDFSTRKFFANVAASDDGDILYPSSNIAIYDSNDDTVKIYDYNFNVLFTLPAIATGATHLSANINTNKYYVGNSGNASGSPTNVCFATIINGVQSAKTDLATPGFGLTCLAANNDDTILYWSGLSGSVNTPVRKWNIPGGVALADFQAAVPNYLNENIIVLEDDTILISYYKQSLARDFYVKRFNAAGTLLNTYNIGTVSAIVPKIARALDSPNSFWSWTQDATGSAAISTFKNIKVSDGSILNTRQHGMFTVGIYDGIQTATPLSRYGCSSSCSFFIMIAAAAPGTGQGGIYFLNPAITHDIYNNGAFKVPDPTIRTALIGE